MMMLLCALLGMGAQAVRAQEAGSGGITSNPNTFADIGPYVGAGYTRAQVNNVFGTTDYNFKIDDNAWKAILGFRFIPPFAVEANYVDLGHQSQGLLGGVPPANAYGHADARAFDLFGVGLLPLGPVDLFGKAGGARWELSGNLSGPGGSLFALDRNGTSFVWGAGAQYHYGPLGLRLEYEHFQMPDTDGARLYTAALTFTF
jgi:predicted porin